MDVLKESLEYLGVAREYHLPLMLTALIMLTVGGGVYAFIREWRSHYRMEDWETIDVQINRLEDRAHGGLSLRFESVGEINIHTQVRGLLARRTIRAAQLGKPGAHLVTLTDPGDHNRLMNRLVSITRTLPGVLARPVLQGYRAALFCERYPNLPVRMKLQLIEPGVLLRFGSGSLIRQQVGAEGLEFPHHSDRIETLGAMARTEETDGRGRHLLRTVRTVTPKT